MGRVGRAIAAAAAAVLVGGCGATVATPVGTTGKVEAPIHYVALGDSYSAGPLVPTPRRDPDGCLRSTNNYPAYLAGLPAGCDLRRRHLLGRPLARPAQAAVAPARRDRTRPSWTPCRPRPTW